MRSLLIPLSVLGALVATAASAEPKGALTERVSYADLNLASPADVVMLDARLKAAVVKVCRPTYMGGQVPFEYVERCAVGARAGYAKPRALALAAAQTKMAAAPAPFIVAGR